MPLFTQIELVARRQTDVGKDQPDYLVYARDRLVGRISCQVATPNAEQWFWGIHGMVTSMEIGTLQGLAENFEQAKTRLRAAFELWLAWAAAAPPSHLSSARIQQACAMLEGLTF
jgi:hypothetical protein